MQTSSETNDESRDDRDGEAITPDHAKKKNNKVCSNCQQYHDAEVASVKAIWKKHNRREIDNANKFWKEREEDKKNRFEEERKNLNNHIKQLEADKHGLETQFIEMRAEKDRFKRELDEANRRRTDDQNHIGQLQQIIQKWHHLIGRNKAFRNEAEELLDEMHMEIVGLLHRQAEHESECHKNAGIADLSECIKEVTMMKNKLDEAIKQVNEIKEKEMAEKQQQLPKKVETLLAVSSLPKRTKTNSGDGSTSSPPSLQNDEEIEEGEILIVEDEEDGPTTPPLSARCVAGTLKRKRHRESADSGYENGGYYEKIRKNLILQLNSASYIEEFEHFMSKNYVSDTNTSDTELIKEFTATTKLKTKGNTDITSSLMVFLQIWKKERCQNENRRNGGIGENC